MLFYDLSVNPPNARGMLANCRLVTRWNPTGRGGNTDGKIRAPQVTVRIHNTSNYIRVYYFVITYTEWIPLPEI